MKQIALLALVLVLFSCNDKTETTPTSVKVDTLKTPILYNIGDDKVGYGIAYRLTKDTFRFTMIDSANAKKKWTKDTLYFLQYSDFVRDTATKKILFDADGKPRDTMYFPHLPTDLVRSDFNINLDSLEKIRLQEGITKRASDSLNKKPNQ